MNDSKLLRSVDRRVSLIDEIIEQLKFENQTLEEKKLKLALNLRKL